MMKTTTRLMVITMMMIMMTMFNLSQEVILTWIRTVAIVTSDRSVKRGRFGGIVVVEPGGTRPFFEGVE